MIRTYNNPTAHHALHSPDSLTMQEHGQVYRPDAAGAQGRKQGRPLGLSAQPSQDHLGAAYATVPVANLAHVRCLRRRAIQERQSKEFRSANKE